jgi:hypothetical protein
VNRYTRGGLERNPWILSVIVIRFQTFFAAQRAEAAQ